MSSWLSATALEIFEPVECGPAAHGVAFDGAGQFARDAQVLAGGPDPSGEATQREFGGVEGAKEAEQPEDDERQGHRHQREDCGAAHRRLTTGTAGNPSAQSATISSRTYSPTAMGADGSCCSLPRVTRADSVVLLNTGHGKGKSSAAFGVMARGWARGWRVGVVQFIKGGKWKTGERKLSDHLGIEWHTLGDGFTWESTDLDETAAKGRHAFEVARDKLKSGDYELLILDEITYAVKYGWVPEADVVAAVRDRAPKTSVVMTGRDATPGLVEIADTVTEMRKVKHAYDEGIKALKGIEY